MKPPLLRQLPPANLSTPEILSPSATSTLLSQTNLCSPLILPPRASAPSQPSPIPLRWEQGAPAAVLVDLPIFFRSRQHFQLRILRFSPSSVTESRSSASDPHQASPERDCSEHRSSSFPVHAAASFSSELQKEKIRI